MFTDHHCGDAIRHKRNVLRDAVRAKIAANTTLDRGWNIATSSYDPAAVASFLAQREEAEELIRSVSHLRH